MLRSGCCQTSSHNVDGESDPDEPNNSFKYHSQVNSDKFKQKKFQTVKNNHLFRRPVKDKICLTLVFDVSDTQNTQ